MLPRWGHSTVAVDLAPGLTEVTVFAGCPQPDPQVKETVILSFGMLQLQTVNFVLTIPKNFTIVPLNKHLVAMYRKLKRVFIGRVDMQERKSVEHP